jgi:hypothetical protein
MAERKYQRRSPLHPVRWQGAQWAVTAYGIESRDGSYTISKDRLSDPYWLDHMSEKEWVDIGDFAEALADRTRQAWVSPRTRAHLPTSIIATMSSLTTTVLRRARRSSDDRLARRR